LDFTEVAIDLPLRSEAPTEQPDNGFTVAHHEHREHMFVFKASLFEAAKGAGLPCDHLAGVLIERFYAPQRKTRKETDTMKHE
jgi:hypothetical protein